MNSLLFPSGGWWAALAVVIACGAFGWGLWRVIVERDPRYQQDRLERHAQRARRRHLRDLERERRRHLRLHRRWNNIRPTPAWRRWLRGL